MSSSLVAVYEQACKNASVAPNSALFCCFAATNQAMPLQVLSLSANLIGPRGLAALLPVLRECRLTLHSVDLSHNNLGNGAVRQLVLCLSNGGFAALRRLELCGNPLTYQGGKCLVHWCEGLQTVRQAPGTQGAGIGEADSGGTDTFTAAQPSDALASPRYGTEYWCDAVDVDINYVGIEGTAMSESLQRALQHRIAAAIARRKARRRGDSSQPRSRGRNSSHALTRKSASVPSTSDAPDSQPQLLMDAESTKVSTPDVLPIMAEVRPSALSLEDLPKDDDDKQQQNDSMTVAVAATDTREAGIPGFLQDDTDVNVLHTPADDDVSGAAAAVTGPVVMDDFRPLHPTRNVVISADGAAGSPLAADADLQQRSLERHRRSRSAAKPLPFQSPSPSEGNGTGARRAVSSVSQASLPSTPLPSSEAFALYPMEPSASQQQQGVGQRLSPPPLKTASNILDELGLEAEAEAAGSAGATGYDSDALPMWLEEM
ncbi:hypothetical protein NXY56_002774 [Leishmania guyanensis]|uniref:Leucine-rich repeat protein n=1 Tax=Leishmania guyanensis TaxID=5670 RepID=A0A1E1IW40_LEIGU|nr:hypothetical protein, conserved [Leishmania guyanensis]